MSFPPAYRLLLAVVLSIGCRQTAYADSAPVSNLKNISINMAVEFMDHAAAAFICRDQGWFREAGLNVTSYESYESGMALAAALARGDVQVAYLCLVPAINAYINAGVPIKIVAGTHKYGYGLTVDKNALKTVHDLEKPGIRIGCVQEGGAVDVLLRRIIDSYRLDADNVLKNVRRMSPARQLLAIQTGQLDAAVLPEQWATMAESAGFKMLLTSRDVWPRMQGSVLVVKNDLIVNHPEVVRKLVDLLRRANDLINGHPETAAAIMAEQMRLPTDGILKNKIDAGVLSAITPDIMLRSMNRMEYTVDIDPEEVQKTINYMDGLGYLKKKGVSAGDILDLRFLDQ